MLRARWYQLYVLAFAALMGLFFAFGLSDSSVMGFTGLGRTLLTFIQVAMLILPIFVLVTTARTLVGDREAGVWEYLLSWPLGLDAYYWGKMSGRAAAIALPLGAAVLLAAIGEGLRGGAVPWGAALWIAAYVAAMGICFVGVAMVISVLAPSQELALGAAFALWLLLEALLDSLLLGLLVQHRLPPEAVMGLALVNPLQAFRTAAIAVFDPQLTVLGPISLALNDLFGRTTLLVWALVWPLAIGVGSAAVGAFAFRRRDITA
jgi:ABC-2 type transport system permease protein